MFIERSEDFVIVRCEKIEESAKLVNGKVFPGGVFRCLRCCHSVESFGSTPGKAVRGAVLKIARSCPRGESNSYKPDAATKQAAKDEHRAMKAERMAKKKGPTA
jgi:hypothetical protein